MYPSVTFAHRLQPRHVIETLCFSCQRLGFHVRHGNPVFRKRGPSESAEVLQLKLSKNLHKITKCCWGILMILDQKHLKFTHLNILHVHTIFQLFLGFVKDESVRWSVILSSSRLAADSCFYPSYLQWLPRYSQEPKYTLHDYVCFLFLILELSLQVMFVPKCNSVIGKHIKWVQMVYDKSPLHKMESIIQHWSDDSDVTWTPHA